MRTPFAYQVEENRLTTFTGTTTNAEQRRYSRLLTKPVEMSVCTNMRKRLGMHPFHFHSSFRTCAYITVSYPLPSAAILSTPSRTLTCDHPLHLRPAEDLPCIKQSLPETFPYSHRHFSSLPPKSISRRPMAKFADEKLRPPPSAFLSAALSQRQRFRRPGLQAREGDTL